MALVQKVQAKVAVEGYKQVSDGLWVPELWFSANEVINGGNTQHFPRETTVTGTDQFINDTGRDMLVPRITLSYGLKPYQVGNYFPEGETFITGQQIVEQNTGFKLIIRVQRDTGRLLKVELFNVPANGVTGLIANARAANGMSVMRLAKPVVLAPEDSLLVKLGHNVYDFDALADQDSYGITTEDSVTKRFAAHARGRITGQAYTLGIVPDSSDEVVVSLSNSAREAIDIYAISFSSSSTSYGIFAQIESAGVRWMRGHRPLWVFADPYVYGRWDLSGLPEGGLVLKPRDLLRVTLHNTAPVQLLGET